MKARRCPFAVIGAGHGGQALAGYLALLGFRVHLFNRSFPRIQKVAEHGGIHLHGAVEGFGRLELVTTDVAEAVAGTRVVLVVVPANAHLDVAHILAPHLRDDQTVVLIPGRTGGAFEFEYGLRRTGNLASVTIAEALTVPFASRITAPGHVTIFGVKCLVPIAALPSARVAEVVEIMQRPFPQFVAAPNVLTTSLNNVGLIFHPAPTLLNAARIESTSGQFDYYHDGISPVVAEVLTRLDAERLQVARAYGVKGIPVTDWLRLTYGADGKTLYDTIQNNQKYRGINAPESLNHRYLTEDVPTGLVPLAELGALVGVPTPVCDMLITLAELISKRDYRGEGRTLERMGLADCSAAAIVAWANDGVSSSALTG